ncbi:efflux RND transporter permease subunit [Succinatimonas hippei]|uniref:Efflux pump membrane transporter n=1 Tax=Succinatimonas hippei (strain DSM 22608 / JCM 16073 / KCTC 15190 / YIT 12066) TaxID=762983 RepID=E8LIH5_SUCHY|nr:efflux RND transporter permease subunit [Succinatimonas hippei]EFY07663.1 putative ATP synthase F0, A subunit [Succinatimonas hippei YIT 12066]MDM8120734.1 efflux RND transporter permease subunit [Succinatimonas hippei]
MARFFINRPIFAWVIAIVIMLAGLFAVLTLPISQYPTIAPPSVSIRSSYPGADATTVERSVTQIIEQNMTGLDGYMYMSATSDSYGNSDITITFEPGTNPDIAQVQVQNKLQQTQSQLPETVQSNGVDVTKSTNAFLMVVGLTAIDGIHDNTDLSDYIYANIREPMARVQGVGDLMVFGSEYAMRIWLDPEKLNNLGVTVTEVTTAITAQNAQVTYGSLGGTPAVPGQQYAYTITGQSRLQNVEQFENILIRVNQDGSKIHLKDIARIELGSESYQVRGSYNHLPSSGIAIRLSSGANALDTAKRVKTLINDLSQYFPEWIEVNYPYDTTDFINISINEVFHTLIEAIILVVIIMYVFLQNIRATLIPTITVPVVLLGTFAIMSVFGFSINTLTMFGLVLAIGLLVDDAIVVVENVERIIHEENLPPKEATERSMDQITGALIGIALVLSAVFIPMAFFGGSTGVIYRQFSITIVSAMTLSVLIALILTPALCATILQGKDHRNATPKNFLLRKLSGLFAVLFKPLEIFFSGFNRFYNALSVSYQKHVSKVVHQIKRQILIYIGICAALVYCFLKIPSAFLPTEDQGVLLAMVNLPSGSTVEKTSNALRKMADYFLIEEKENVASMMYVTGFSFAGSGQNAGLAFVRLKDWSERTRPDQHADAIANRSYQPLMGIREGLAYAFNIPAIPELGTANGFDMYLMDNGGAGHDALTKVRQDYVYAAQQSPLLMQVRANGMDDAPQFKLNLDYEKAMSLGLTVADINNTLSVAWGSAYIDDFMERSRVKKVYLQAEASARMTELDLNKWYVRNNEGKMIPFSAFASTEWTFGSPRLERYNGVGAMNIQGAPAPGVSTGEAMNEMERIAAEVLPPGYSISWTGVSYQERLSGQQAPMLYAVSILVVFLCLAALYESWSIPFAVMMVLPLGIIGAVLAALITQYVPVRTVLTNDVYFQVGLLTTVGLSAKNAILIVEFAKELYDKGARLTEAVIEAAKIRLRPILMTSAAFILGVLPLAVSSGAGAAGRNEIGICVIGGMLSATVLAIFFVPVFFVLIMRYFTKYIPPETKKKLAERERQRLEKLYQQSREADEAKRIDNL